MRWFLLAALIAFAPMMAIADSGIKEGGLWRPWEYGPPQSGYPKPPAASETLTEAEIEALPRDERRTKYIEGFSCSMFIYGQVGFMRFEPGGVGYAGHQEDSVKFAWWVRNDQYCTQYPRQVEPRCSDLPKRRLPDEREAFQKWMTKSCI